MSRPTPKAETRAVLRAEMKGDKGELHIYGSIGGWFGIEAKDVAEKVSELTSNGSKSLDVYINSPGGVAFDGIAMHYAIKRFPGKKTVHVDGIAASAASLVAMAGDEIRVPSGAQIMIHGPHAMAVGGAADMRKLADELDGLRSSMIDLYAERTKAKRSDLEQWVDAETWMDGKTALDRGFATHVDSAKAEHDKESVGEIEDSVLRQFVATWRNAPPSIAEKYLTPKLAVALASAKQNAPDEPAASKEPTVADPKKQTSTETAEAAAVPSRADFYEPFLAEVKALTGKEALTEAIGVMTAWKSASESAAALAKENAELKAQYAEGESTRLVEAAVRDGRLPPARREQAMGIGAKSVDGLKAFLEALTPLPVAVRAREHEAATAKTASPKGASASEPSAETPFGGPLSKKQKLALHGVNEAEFLAHWNKRKAEQAALNAEVDE